MNTSTKRGGQGLTSFFGGDPRKAHFSTHYWEDRKEYNRLSDEWAAEYRRHGRSAKWYKLREEMREAHAAMKADYRAKRDRMKELGYETRYFQFRVGDEAAKAKAKADCEAFAAEWAAKLGFELSVGEGCFL